MIAADAAVAADDEVILDLVQHAIEPAATELRRQPAFDDQRHHDRRRVEQRRDADSSTTASTLHRCTTSGAPRGNRPSSPNDRSCRTRPTRPIPRSRCSRACRRRVTRTKRAIASPGPRAQFQRPPFARPALIDCRRRDYFSPETFCNTLPITNTAEAEAKRLQPEGIRVLGVDVHAEEALGQAVQLAPLRGRLVGHAELGEQPEQEHADAVEQPEQAEHRDEVRQASASRSGARSSAASANGLCLRP